MKVRMGPDVTAEEAAAVASALADHLDEPVEIYVGEADTPAAVGEPAGVRGESPGVDAPEPAADLGPTDSERHLRDAIAAVHEGGPEEYRDRLAESGKLFVRDRLELWFGESGFDFEDGTFANADADERLPADGLLTGAATFEGRHLHVMANDYTVKAGSIAERGVEKFLRLQERALETGRPVLYLVDSSGGRIDEQTGFFANRHGIGRFYFNHARLSGRVPQICVLYGPCIAGAAYTPVFADFTVMVEGMSAMAIASPRMVEMVTGELIDLEDLGGPSVHSAHSGSADLVAADEHEARALVAQLLSFLPDDATARPPVGPPEPPAAAPAELDAVIPADPNESYDMSAVIQRLVDRRTILEVQPEYGPEILTLFARIEGRPVGVIANQPARRAGAIFPESARKAAEFAWKCDAFNVPLVYLCDTPGFMVGSQVERAGILEAGKKMIYAASMATVPKLCVIVRKAYGAGIYAMAGPAYEPEATIALPSGEIAIMGPEAAVNAVYANRLADIDDAEDRRRVEAELREAYREDIDVRRLASDAVIDEIVPPSGLRAEVAARLDFYADVEKSRPGKKHGTVI